jgi:hypothetical protein
MKIKIAITLFLISFFTNAFSQQKREQCNDPWANKEWYKIVENEIYDFKQLLVWHRCPALYTENGKCVAEKTLPSENFNSAKKIPSYAPKGNWRLPKISELNRIVAKNCDYQFPENVIELPPAPLWSSTSLMGGIMKINESGQVFVDKKDEISWTLYVKDFSIKEMLDEKNNILLNITKLTDEDVALISKKSSMKLVKLEIFFEDGMSRVQSDNECYANLNQFIFSVSCKFKDGTFTHNKHKIDCQGKRGSTLICINETIESSTANLIGNTIRTDVDIKDGFLKQTAHPIYRGGTLMPYRIESIYSIAR